MGWVHHVWLSCNPPICWMRQNMANGHPDSGGHVITSLRHGGQCLDKMTHNVDTLPENRGHRLASSPLELRADLLFQWSGSLVSRRGASHSAIFRHSESVYSYSQKHDFQEYWKDKLQLHIERSDIILFSEFTLKNRNSALEHPKNALNKIELFPQNMYPWNDTGKVI